MMSTLQTVLLVALIWGVFIGFTLGFMRVAAAREREERAAFKKCRSRAC